MLTYTPARPRLADRPPSTELNAERIATALAGDAEAKALTIAERKCVVRYLATVEKLTDDEIAERLHWENGSRGQSPGSHVREYRRRWEIQSGTKLARQAPARPDVVHDAIAGKLTKADLRPKELRAVVRHLATTGRKSDLKIALLLNWAPNRKLPRRALYVYHFRRRWEIPSVVHVRPAPAATDHRELVNVA